MDSITQATLGAAVGEAVLGKKIGNKAILWGALAGTIPDLDVALAPFLDGMGMITVHRGLSHSIFFAVFGGLLLGWLFYRWYKGDESKTTFRDWSLLFVLGLLTHSLLDACTTYGTQLLSPFSDYRVAFNNIFIVDPFYTLPFLLSIIICLFLNREGQMRRIVSWTGIGLSVLYLCFTLVGKYFANDAFETALATQNIDYQRFRTGPTPLNSILWYGVVEVEDGYLFGDYSLLDKDKDINFIFYEKNEHLIKNIKDQYAIDRLIWFSNGYYVLNERDGQLQFFDVKFGKTTFKKAEPEDSFVFFFQLHQNEESGEWYFRETQRRPAISVSDFFDKLWTRIKGEEI